MDERQVAERFGHSLWRNRRRARLSQQGLADRVEIHRTEVSLLERGLRRPRLDTILKLCAGVQASPCELLAGLRWRPGHGAAAGIYLDNHEGGP